MNSDLVTNVICPHCHSEVDAHRAVCSQCHQPLRVDHHAPRRAKRRVIDRPWILAILLLHVGFLGIPVYWKTSYSVAVRLLICLASIAYTVFAVGFIVIVGTWIYQRFTGAQ